MYQKYVKLYKYMGTLLVVLVLSLVSVVGIFKLRKTLGRERGEEWGGR